MAQENSGFTLINGNEVAKVIRGSLSSTISSLCSCHPSLPTPCLAVILVGDRRDSQSYVNMKSKACVEVGVTPVQLNMPGDTSQEQLESEIARLNGDVNVNGILVQLPLPAHLDAEAALALIAPNKDVDGLTNSNAGDVLKRGVRANMIACTPLGCIALLDHYNIPIAGKHAVVIGRSNLVGKPVAQLLLSRDATVTQCHSRTVGLDQIVKQADIVVACLGKAGFIQASWLKPGCAVIDVGTNAVDDASKKAGYRLVGDVDFEGARNVAAYATPVPGGVGPMTVTMLLKNTIKAWHMQHGVDTKQ